MPTADLQLSVALRVPADIVLARQAGRDAARSLGLGLADQTRLATAISEIARNALNHAGSGTCDIVCGACGDLNHIIITITDQGPGIPDIGLAMTPGYSTNQGLGLGLPGAGKLVDALSIESRPGCTRVELRMLRRAAA